MILTNYTNLLISQYFRMFKEHISQFYHNLDLPTKSYKRKNRTIKQLDN